MKTDLYLEFLEAEVLKNRETIKAQEARIKSLETSLKGLRMRTHQKVVTKQDERPGASVQ